MPGVGRGGGLPNGAAPAVPRAPAPVGSRYPAGGRAPSRAMSKDGASGAAPAGAPRLPPRQAATAPAAPPGPAPPPPPPAHEEHRRELEALRAELEGERLRSQEARRRFGLEARELREAAERERQLLADQLRSKWEQQRARELHQLREDGRRQREAEIRQLLRWKEAELREAQELLQRERDAAMRQARDLQRQLAEELVSRGGRAGAGAGLSGEGRARLQEVLGKLRWEVDGEQAARIRHLKAELELERSLFLKYILERFEGALPPPAGPPRARPPAAAPPAPGSGPKPDKRRPRSLESLYARPESAARKARSLHGHVKPAGPSQPSSDARGSPQGASQDPEQPPSASPPGTPEAVEDGAQPEVPLGKNQVGPPGEEAATGPEAEQQQQQQQQRLEPSWLTGSHYQQLEMQNMDLVKALADLEQRCTRLKDENVLLRKNSFPEMQEKVKQLKRKNGQLASIAKRLEEWARKLRESSLQAAGTSVPLAWNRLEVDLSRTMLARQQEKHLGGEASVLITKDQQLQALQEDCSELQSRFSADEENSSLDSLLRQSQREVLQLQRQIMLKTLSESLQHSKLNTEVASPEAATQETSPTPAGGSEKPPSPKEAPERLIQDVRSEAPTLGNGAEDARGHHPETDVDDGSGDPPLQVLKEQLAERLRQCELLQCEVQEKKKTSDYLEGRLKQVLSENARIARENAELHEKSRGAENIRDENAEIRLKLIQAAEDRNSAVQWSKRLEDKVENLEQVLKSMKETEERQRQLESEHKETLLVLRRKEEEIKHLEQMQTGIKREHREATQILEAQVGELETKYRSRAKHFNLLLQELERLQIQEPGLSKSLLPPAPHHSQAVIASEKREPDTQPGFRHGQTSSDKNGIALNWAGLPRNSDGLQSLPDSSSGLPLMKDSLKRCPREEDTEEGPETDEVPPNFPEENQGPSNLRVFLVRHSYYPFRGPNKNPEAELPLTAGEYVYVCGETDADGFYEGELMDGRRGLIPSNLVEEVSANDLMSFAPSEPSDICYNPNHERGFSCHSASSEERSDSPDGDTCVHPLSIRPKDGLWDHPRVVPYPQNLTLIKQSSTSITIGWDPPSMQSHWRKIHSYNIYINADLFQNVKHGRQMKATIENLDLKLRPYRISVQSVTGVGNSDSKQCTFLVGTGAVIAPTLLRLQKVTATSAEITWLPSNSNHTHVVYLNEKEHDETETGVYWYVFQTLTPGSLYCIRVEAQVLRETPLFPQENLEQTSAAVTFMTPSAGPPDAPLDVQVQPSSSEEFFIVSWLPVTIDAVGSSNGVQVSGYAVYINGQKVTEVMSATAGSVSLAPSQLGLFDGSWKVSVRTLSPVGESEDSVPALIPPFLLKAPPLLPRSVASNQIPDLNFQEFLQYEDGHLSTKNNAPPSILSHKSMTSADPNFIIHFTSSCRESTSTPLDIFQNRLPTSTLASSPNAPNENRGGSSQHSSVGKPSSGHVCPLLSCEEPASSTPTALKVLPRETQLSLLKKEKLEEYSVTKQVVSRIHPDHRNIKMYTMTHYASMTPEVSSHQPSFDYPGSSCLNPESSVEFEVKNCSYRNVGTYNVCFQIEPYSYFEKNHMGEMEHFCKEFSNLSVSQAKRGQQQISKTESPQIHPGDHNHVSDLSDAQEEKNKGHRMNLLGQENSRSYPRPVSPVDLANDRITTVDLQAEQPISSAPNSGSLRSLNLGIRVSDGPVRLFVALFDYDPITISPSSDGVEIELAFKKGQILKVIGDKDVHGFYRAECEGKEGYIPCNLVSEIYIESKEVKEELLKTSYIKDENL
ncbi:RIMS-binding protein 3C-like [Candoia aspera]|uniref:RIMS-binding protein 3C-like n=1 Tax=Candoia aspera TaxID=51853 RepID=UPI002FD81825